MIWNDQKKTFLCVRGIFRKKNFQLQEEFSSILFTIIKRIKKATASYELQFMLRNFN